MTERAEIERLLNQTGRTLEGLPCGYNPYKIGGVEKEYRFADRSVDTYSMANRILHQSDVIELLVGALRDALDVQETEISDAEFEEFSKKAREAMMRRNSHD